MLMQKCDRESGQTFCRSQLAVRFATVNFFMFFIMKAISPMFRALVLAGLLTFLGGAAGAKPVPPTIAQLAAFPKMSGFALSPDGTHIAALEARGEDRVILVWKTDAMNAQPTVLSATKMKIQAVAFVKNDVLAVSLWQPLDARDDRLIKVFIGKLYFTDLEGKNWREPLPLPRAASKAEEIEQARTSPIVLDGLVNDPDNVLIVNNIGANSGDVFRVNVRTNRAERIERREERVGGYLTDLEGKIRARTKADVDAGGAYISAEFKSPNGTWEEHFRSYVKNRDVTNVIGFTNDPNIALVRSNVGRDKAIIYEYDVAKRAKVETLFEHRFFEAEGVRSVHVRGPMFGEIAGLTYDGPRGNDVQWIYGPFQNLDATIRKALNITATPTRFVDPATGQSATAPYDADVGYDLAGYTPDLKTVLFATEGPNRPRTYYLLRNNQLSMLAKTYSDIDPASLGATKLVYYKARDGLDIPAFLTTPNTELCGPGPWKTVLNPHGGPWARDHLRFDTSMWIPMLASRCMAVLQPQYRGSDGWSRKLWMAGDAEWGQKMQDDKDDGAKWLVDQKIAQPGHIAMFGFSYGGYAAMAASVRPNGIYKCAIAGAGVSDIKRIFRSFFENPFFLEAQAPTIDGLNPVDFADKIQIPIMVYGGDRDRTVPIEQSEWFVAKARKSSQPVVYREFTDYAHGPAWTRATFGEQLKGIDDYLATGCGAGGL
jgi:pimeloyl-ACP methyl ester carboxylesterase